MALRTKYQTPGSKTVYLLSLSNQKLNKTFLPAPHIFILHSTKVLS